MANMAGPNSVLFNNMQVCQQMDGSEIKTIVSAYINLWLLQNVANFPAYLGPRTSSFNLF